MTTTHSAATADQVKVPARLEPFGLIGWALFVFDSLEKAHAWAAAHPSAYMRCWRRPECWGGRPLGAP